MVYCTKCGTQNPDNATTCVSCGQPLQYATDTTGYRRRRDEGCFGENRPDPCFGSSGRGLGWILVGVFIIAIGGMYLLQQYYHVEDVGPFVLVLLGIMVIIAAIISYTRRR